MDELSKENTGKLQKEAELAGGRKVPGSGTIDDTKPGVNLSSPFSFDTGKDLLASPAAETQQTRSPKARFDI